MEQSALKKCKQLFKHQHFLLLKRHLAVKVNLYLNVVHFFDTNVKISVAALDSCFPAL